MRLRRGFKTATSLDPQYAEAENNLGVVYGQQGKSAEAEKLFRQAVENNPQYAQAFVNLGLILAGQSRFPEANQALQTAVRLEPNNTKALSSRAMVLIRLGQPAEAVTDFRKVVELDSRSPDAHLNLGIALADQFDLEGALKEIHGGCKTCSGRCRSALQQRESSGRSAAKRGSETRTGDNHTARSEVCGCMVSAGDHRETSGETKKAVDLFGKAVSVIRTMPIRFS